MTSINDPNWMIEKYTEPRFAVAEIYVSGDLKTPDAEWENPPAGNIQYLSHSEQSRQFPMLARRTPDNHYSRKLFAYLAAIRDGATRIIDTDDDNFPTADFPDPSALHHHARFYCNPGWVNIHRLFGDKTGWPRGFPLDEVRSPQINALLGLPPAGAVAVVQGLVDSEPDVDAIYRMTNQAKISFNSAAPLVLDIGAVSPFNSQNTLFTEPVFPLLYLPTTVSSRFSDILRSIVAQPIMWRESLLVGFCSPNATQIRNIHNLFADFLEEITMYTSVKKALEIAIDSTMRISVEDNLHRVYEALALASIVDWSELATLEAWLEELSNV